MKVKMWAYILIVLGFISIVVSVVVIVGSIFVETKLVDAVDSVYQPVQRVYSDVDVGLTETENNVSNVQNNFNTVSGQLSKVTGNISDQTRQVLTNGIDGVQGKVTKVQGMINVAKDAVNTVNEKIDVVNSLQVATLSKLSGEKVNEASVKVDDAQNSLNKLKSDLQNDGKKSKPVVAAVNQSLDQVQNILKGYHADIDDAQNKAKSLKDFIIIWSTAGTVFIVLFFIWTIYSFVYLMKNQFMKLKNIRQKGTISRSDR